MVKKLSQLIDGLPDGMLVELIGQADADVSGAVVESDRDLQPGGIFVARRGLSVDGHQFINSAIERGAAVVVGEHEILDLPVPYVRVNNAQAATGYLAAAYHDHPSRKLTVIGITGTDGKTTTSHLLHSILRESTQGHTGFISTIAADFGGRQRDTGLHVTTPGAPQVQAYLAEMVDAGLTHVVLEMTSHGLEQGRLNGVDIDVAIVTNIQHEHLDFHGSWENYRKAKARLFENLSQSYRKRGQPKIAVLNADDAGSYQYLKQIPADQQLSYGIVADADFAARDIEYLPDGVHFSVNGVPYSMRLVGEFNVSNALAAITAATGLGCEESVIQQGIASLDGVSGRMERIDEGQDFMAVVDFAHTPNALKRALEAGRTMLPEGKRLIAVFGSAGLRDVEKRRMMAEISAQLADVSVLTAEDPRTENLDGILSVMAKACESQGGVEGQSFIRVPDRGEALYRACQMAESGDLVMACGKGHEQSMCFGTIEYPWDDRDALRAALRGEPLRTLPTAQ